MKRIERADGWKGIRKCESYLKEASTPMDLPDEDIGRKVHR